MSEPIYQDMRDAGAALVRAARSAEQSVKAFLQAWEEGRRRQMRASRRAAERAKYRAPSAVFRSEEL